MTAKKECCDYCMWFGTVNSDGTMRKHYVSDRVGRYGRRVQVRGLGVCEGSHKSPVEFAVR